MRTRVQNSGTPSTALRVWLLSLCAVIGLGVASVFGVGGCGGVGASGSAPSDTSGGGVIAVEIPSFSEVPYISAAVVTSASLDLTLLKSAHATKSSDPQSFSISAGTNFSAGQSIAACEARNDLNLTTSETASFDIQTCYVRTNVLADATSAGIDLYDGNPHVFEYTYADYNSNQLADVGLLDKIKLIFVRDSAGNLTRSEEFGCNNGVQTFYERYDIDGLNVTINAKSTLPAAVNDSGYDPDHIRQVVLTGTVNPDDTTLYGSAKTFSVVSVDGLRDADLDVVQGQVDILFNSYTYQEYSHVGLYAYAQLSNPSDGSLNYTLGDGAGVINDPLLTPDEWTEAWDGTTFLPLECLVPYSTYCQAVVGHTPKSSIRTVTPFAEGEIWDCSGAVEHSFSNHNSASCLLAFYPDDLPGILPCTLETGNMPESTPEGFTVSLAADSGGSTTALSEDGSNTQIALGSTIQLSFNKAAYPQSFNSSNVALYDKTGSCDWETPVDLDLTNLSDDARILTLSPTLQVDHRYVLAIAGLFTPTSVTAESLSLAGHYLEPHVNYDDGIVSDTIVYNISVGEPPVEDCTIGDDPLLFVAATHTTLTDDLIALTVIVPDRTLPPIGIESANEYCNSHIPEGISGKTFKALIAGGDWTLQPNATYRRPSGTVIDTTTVGGFFSFPLDHVLTLDFGYDAIYDAWTGLNADGSTASHTCNSWSSNSSDYFGTTWLLTSLGDESHPITYGGLTCDLLRHLICVQQTSGVTHTVGGTISGQTGEVRLRNNGGDEIVVAAEASTFVFTTPIDNNSTYDVTVSGNPAGQACSISGEQGTALGDVTSVTVTCASSLTIFVTLSQNNAPDGFAVADATCMADDNKPDDGATYKALIVDNTNRRACVTDNCSVGHEGEHIGWILQPNQTYTRQLDGAVIGTTTADGIFEFPLDAAFTTEDVGAWTGITTVWTEGFNCNGWTESLNSGVNAEYGMLYNVNSNSIDNSFTPCSPYTIANLICVEQP